MGFNIVVLLGGAEEGFKSQNYLCKVTLQYHNIMFLLILYFIDIVFLIVTCLEPQVIGDWAIHKSNLFLFLLIMFLLLLLLRFRSPEKEDHIVDCLFKRLASVQAVFV